MATLKFGTLIVTQYPNVSLSATHNLTNGKATFGQVIPQGAVPEGSAIQVGSLETQTDIKTTWDDGSARFAILTCIPNTTSNQTLSVIASDPGTFSPTIPATSVEFTISGTVWTATLPGSVSEDLWLDGSLVKEWRSIVTPVDPSSNEHASLRVYFDVRVYSDESSRVDVAVENLVDVIGGGNVTYDVDINVDGESVFSQDSVVHYYLTRWRKVFGVGLTESTVTIDWEPAVVAKALPRYLNTVSNSSYSTAGPTFVILGRGGNVYDAMGTAGGREEIAPYPDWTARFIVHKEENQRDFVMANGDLAGSWPVHIRNTDGSLISIDDRPNFWLDYRGEDKPLGDIENTGPLIPDTSHVPSLAYVPYLATGDRYYADEMAFWANYALTATWFASLASYGRGGSFGLVGTEQTRGRAWGLRNLVDAASYFPDGNFRNYLASKAQNNIGYYSDVPSGQFPHRLGNVQWLTTRNTPPTISVSLWEHDYLAWSLDHANKQGFSGGVDFRNQVAQFHLDLFQTPDVPPEFAGVYVVPIASNVDSVITDFTTILQSYEARDPGDNLSFVFYGINSRLMVLIALRNEWAGAQDVYDYLSPIMEEYLEISAGWAIESL